MAIPTPEPLDHIGSILAEGTVMRWTPLRSESGLAFPAGQDLDQALGLVADTLVDLLPPADADAVRSALQRSEPFVREIPLHLPDGSRRWIELGAVPSSSAHGPPWVGFVRDVSQRRQAIGAALEGSDTLRAVVAQSPIEIAMFDRDLVYLAVSRRWLRSYGLTDDAVGKGHYDLFPDLPERWKEIHRACLGGAVREAEEDGWIRADGTRRWIRWAVHPWYARSGEVGGLIITSEDVTARKEAQDALRDREDQYRSLVEESLQAVFVNRGGVVRFVNRAALTLFGAREPTELVGRTVLELIAPAYHDLVRSRVASVLDQVAVPRVELEIVRLDGERRRVEAAAARFSDRAGTAIQVVMQDVTEQREAARHAREVENRMSAIVHSTMDGVVTVDEEQRIVLANPAAERMFGYGPGELLGRALGELIPLEHRERHGQYVEAFGRAGEPHRRMTSRAITGLRATGAQFPLEATISQVEVAGRKLFTVVHRDLSESERARRELEEQQTRFRQLTESIREVFWLTDATQGTLLYLSPAYETVWGRSVRTAYESPSAWLEAVHPEDRERVAEASRRQHLAPYDQTYRIVRPDGSIRWIHDRGFPVRDREGVIHRIAGVADDVTDQKRIEEQMRAAQRMESVGQLAGGIAHDFNNLLTVIVSAAELLARGPSPELLEDILDAARRGAALTRQLLAFSRREVLEPRVVHLAELVAETDKLLRRLIGEHILLTTRFHAPCPVRIDPGQWSQVLVNLAVNARDAMPAGGHLVIETRVERGEVDQAVLEVADTGAGMTSEVRERLFEPFFTTKPRGKGTGLGLAVVHGIVQQAGGTVEVRSEVGVGTRFLVRLPLVALPPQRKGATEPPSTASGTETVLLVEDEPVVRRVATRILQAEGYVVLPAADGREALALLAARPTTVDLLLTDVVMPHLAGPELVREVRARHPSVAVLYVSGYVDDEIRDRIQPDEQFLQKPYSPRTLLSRVRETLDRPRRPVTSGG